MTTDPQKLNAGELVDKAREMAREHPDQAREAVDKAQDFIKERTGGRFDSAVDAGGDAVEDQLGLPQQEQEDDPKPSPQPGPQRQPDDAPSTHPAPDTDPQTRPADPPPGGPMEPGEGKLPG